MAETSIGKASLQLSVNASRLTSGLSAVGKQIRAAANDWQSLTFSAGQLVTKGLAAGLVGIGAAGAAGLAAFTAATLEAKEKIAELNKVATGANPFGLSTQSGTGLFGLAKSAGSDVKDFTESLATMSQRANETGEVAASMFKGLNLEAAEFGKMRTDEQWYRVMDAIAAVQNPAERVRLAFLAFGEDGGKTILPLVGKTSTELRKMADGFSVTALEMNKIGQAQSSITKLDGVFDRLKTKLAVAAAPFIQSIADAISGIDVEAMGRKFTKVYDIATDVFQRVREFSSDQFAKLSADLDGWLTKSVSPAVKPGSDPKGNPAVSQFARSVADFGRYVGKIAGDTVDNTSGVWNAYSYMFDSVMGNAQSGLGWATGSKTLKELGDKTLKNADDRLRQAGDDFAGNTGDKWGKVGENLGLKAGNAIAAVVDKALTPKQRYAEVGLEFGLAAIEGAEQSLRQVADTAKDGKGEKGDTKNTAYVAGTAEELSFRLRALQPQGDVAKQQLAEAKKQTALHKETVDAIKAWIALPGPAVAD